jgi:hypothetical protein
MKEVLSLALMSERLLEKFLSPWDVCNFTKFMGKNGVILLNAIFF